MFRIEQHKELTNVTTYADTSLGIMRWGQDNSFPKTLENLIKQSASAYSAIKRTAKFYKGAGFEGENTPINNSGLTLKKLVSIMAEDYALYNAFALQCNYNIKGQVTSINPMRIADLRFKEFDELNNANKIGYYYNFGRNSEVKRTVQHTATREKIKWFDRYNPDPEVVLNQIENTEGGISNYLGQILYYSEEGFSSYPIPPLQPAINFVLSDIENSILVRKEVSTGFLNSYILKTTLDSEDPTLQAWENAIEEAQGAMGNGKVITVSGLSPEDLSSTLLEEIGSGSRDNAINSAKLAYELNRDVINGVYLIPPALAGIDQKTGFSGADLQEAYFVFNAVTQNGRDVIEAELNKILSKSVFNLKEIKINKITLDVDEVNNDVINKSKDNV